MALILSRKTGRRVAASGRRTSPKHHIFLVLPCDLHIISGFPFQIDSVPSIRILRRRLVVIMRRYPNIRISLCFCRREDGVQHRNSSPVGEEMSLLVMLGWILTKIILIIDAQRKRQVVIQRYCRLSIHGSKQVDHTRSLGRRLDRRKKLASLRVWRTSSSPGFPHVAVSAPVRGEI